MIEEKDKNNNSINGENNSPETNNNLDENGNYQIKDITYLPGMYENWFLDYASYVILERAVPHVYDGLKPVHRRILHAMKKLDDGRFNKVANIIGNTMQYHPHGDASIGDALVHIGQKNLLIDTQGNWGNIFTGDRAAASRYIEARLSKFALEVVFNNKTTFWKSSYDGRNKEPIALPVKFPLLLSQGAEGIAVGLASKILPHNFNELIDASIACLENREFQILPDFLSGGLADFSKYNDGARGGKIRVRARINKTDNKTLTIIELPFGKTTSSLIDSIVAANDKGKIKIKKIDDNTSENVEIQIHLTPGTSSDKTIDALYAFTDCEVSISPNVCVIENDKPKFLTVSEILKISTQNTLELLRQELLIRKNELEEAWHLSSLEKIFIENKIYRDIEECETWESIIETIDKGLDPFKKLLIREVSRDDIIKLTEIKIKRISKYDALKADEYIKSVEEEIKDCENKLNHIIEYTIDYFKSIKKKYGKDRERKTEIRNFDTIVATKVVVANQKLYVDRKEGFVGTSLRKEEFICECSDIDDIIVFRKDGTYFVTKVADKLFVGINPIHIGIFKKDDNRTIYNVIYRNGRVGKTYMKRFAVKGVTREKEYNITQGTPDSKILYFTANPNGEAEVVRINIKPKPKLKKLVFDVDLGELAVKGRSSLGNILSKNPVQKISLKEKGLSTLGGQNIWFDEDVFRLNTDERGKFLGEFKSDDKILIISKSGFFRLSTFELSNHYEEDILIIKKFQTGQIFSAIYYNSKQEYYYLKRFTIDPQHNGNKRYRFIDEDQNSKLYCLSDKRFARFEIIFGGKHKQREKEIIDVEEFISIKSFKAKGKRLTTFQVKSLYEIEPVKTEEEIIDFEIEDIPESVLEEQTSDEKIIDTTENSDSDNDSMQMTLEL
ncbi:DNA gyrase/topoisomerase IV subunit A [Bacteroidota bacterium]